LQLFHFNGASPLTTFSKLLLPGTEIDQLAWDNNNHLYALSYKVRRVICVHGNSHQLQRSVGVALQGC
jgi:hypothetical protein